MNKGAGLKVVVGCLVRHAGGRELAQLVVDERKQTGGRLSVAGGGCGKKLSHLGHTVGFYQL